MRKPFQPPLPLQTKVVFDGLGPQIRSELKEIGAACIATIQSYAGRGRAFKVTNPIPETTCTSASLTPKLDQAVRGGWD